MVTSTGARLSRKRMVLLFLVGLAVVALGVALLGAQPMDRRRNGTSQSEAIMVAWQHTGMGAVALKSAEIRHDFRTGFDLPTHRWAWVVTFNGQWHLLCSGHVPNGSCDPTSEWVAIDYYTGQWIASEFSYPAGP